MSSMRSFVFAILSASLLSACVADLSVDPPAPPTACEPEGLEPLLEAFPPCDLGQCGPTEDQRMRGRCVDVNQVEESQRSMLSPCENGYSLCVPVDMLLRDGRHKPVECVSLGGLEGRCMSECIPQVNEQQIVLPTEGCNEGERCAPCYDPTTGESSGACDASQCDVPNDPQPDFCTWDYDANPIIDTSLLEPCPTAVCDQPSHCLPNALVPDAQRDLLGACDAERKCVPDTILVSGGNRPAPTCTSIGGAEGRCQSTCIPEVGAQAEMLPADICDAATERCAPCYDPVTGDSTGACEGMCDAPVDPPYVFTSCCEDRAKCVPETAVPADQASSLAQKTCASGELCVPTEFTDPAFSPPSCLNFADAPGACISTCVPAANLGSTEPECPVNTKCVACDVLGIPTGACSL